MNDDFYNDFSRNTQNAQQQSTTQNKSQNKQTNQSNQANQPNGASQTNHCTDPYELLVIAVSVAFLLTSHFDTRQLATIINLLNLLTSNLESWLAQQEINSGQDITPTVDL